MRTRAGAIPGESDAFLAHTDDVGGRRRAGGKLDDSKSMHWAAANLIALPWLIFVAITVLYTVLYHHYREVVWLVSLGGLALSFMFMSLAGRMDGRWYLFLGVLCSISVVMGNVWGFYNYHEYMLQYWAYDQNRLYTNVLPSEPAAAHADAGRIIFADSARIDTTKAVGFKAGDVYCVAPVMDETQTSRVEYWAAGVNCCKQRADFNCGSASDPSAHQAVVILDTNSFMASDRDYYVKAVKTAEAAYDIVSAPAPLFVKWVSDSKEVQQDYYKAGVGTLLIGIFVYLLLSVVLGVAGSVMSRRQARPGA
jgi:hypothetical protein